MRSLTKTLVVTALTGLLLANCGKNPFGSGAPGGLSLFAKIGKAMAKPAGVHDEENGKEGSKAVVASAASLGKRLAKGEIGNSDWLVSNGITIKYGGASGDTLVYWEEVLDKPDETNPFKLATGRGEIAFKYTGTVTLNPANLQPNLITDVYSFKFDGIEKKPWKSEVCSVRAEVRFSEGNIQDLSTIKPGKTWFWGRNISVTLDQGRDDTAYFAVDSLDDVKHEQYGRGSFLDAHSGKDNSGAAKSFNFDVTILHKNSLGGNPYLRYEDNEGIMSFMYPWGDTGDSLYFTIHFYPNNERTGTIRKNGASGPVLVEFTHNEYTGAGQVTYYNEKGEEIASE